MRVLLNLLPLALSRLATYGFEHYALRHFSLGEEIRDDVLIRTTGERVRRGSRADPGPRYVFKPFGPRSEAIPKVSEFLLHPGHETQPTVQS